MEASEKPKPQKRGLRPIGSQLPDISTLEASLVSTKGGSAPKLSVSGTTPKLTTDSSPTGTQVSVCGFGKPPASLDEAQTLLANAKPGQVDAAIQAWLPRSVSSRIAERLYDGQDRTRDYTVVGYDLDDGFNENDGRESLRLLEMLNARAEPETCEHELARLKVLTATRNLSQADLTAQIAIYAEELTEYPIDVVRESCRWWAAREKWFPSWAELRDACEERVMKRRAILTGLRRYFERVA